MLSQRIERFRREAQVLASLNHPHIGAIHSVEEADGRPFLVLELVDGAQIERYAASGAGVYAFSRVDASDKVEYLVAVNNATSAQTVDLKTLTADAGYSVIYGDGPALTTDAGAATTITVPALSALVWKAEATVSAPAVPTMRSPTATPPKRAAAMGGWAKNS